jgi:hypothetical protein
LSYKENFHICSTGNSITTSIEANLRERTFLLIEAETHVTVLLYLCSVLEQLGTVHVVASKVVCSELAKGYHKSFQAHLAEKGLKNWEALAYELPSSFDEVIVTTSGSSQYEIRKLISLKGFSYSLLVHNLNYEVNPAPRMVGDWMSPLRKIKWMTKRSYWNRLWLAQNSRRIVVTNKLSERYIRRMGIAKPILAIPWAICSREEAAYANLRDGDENIINLLIVGEIDSRRRDLNSIIHLLANYAKPHSIRVDLVGAMLTADSIKFSIELDSLCKVRGIGLEIHGSVSVERLRSLLDQSTALWLPFGDTVRYLFVQEIGGVTKISGVVHDAIRACKPLLIDERYQIDHSWPEFYIKYDPKGRFEEIERLFDQLESPEVFGLGFHLDSWCKFLEY